MAYQNLHPLEINILQAEIHLLVHKASRENNK